MRGAIVLCMKVHWLGCVCQKFLDCGLQVSYLQFGQVPACTVPFDKKTGFHRGMGWIQFASEKEPST